ncbi:MAG: DUF4367 domain-containing protein [Lachnospiraceae bacterium]|nr:DUF4367 domain-containing protein [Lachnospiraceae bacterium]
MTDYDKVLIEELERRLLWFREEASEEEFDAEEVDAICTMLSKLSPENKPHRTKEETYQNILKQVSLEEELSQEKNAEKTGGERADGGKKSASFAGRLGLRAATILLVAAGALVSLNMVSYAKENKSLFTMIMEKVGWLEIEKEPDTEGEILSATWASGEFYESWTELDYDIKKEITAPGYIPEGYGLYGIRSWDLNDRRSVQADYYDRGNGHILFEITLWENGAEHYRENAMEENLYELIPEQSDENTLYYVYEDEYICLAFMENSFYRISGNIGLEDMIKIRGGI